MKRKCVYCLTSGPLTSASTPEERTHVTQAYTAHRPPAQTATCPMGLSKLTARRRRTLKRTVCGAAAARPPHTESLSGTSLKWLAKFTEHFHLCAPPPEPPTPHSSHHYFDFAHMLRPSADIHHWSAPPFHLYTARSLPLCLSPPMRFKRAFNGIFLAPA